MYSTVVKGHLGEARGPFHTTEFGCVFHMSLFHMRNSTVLLPLPSRTQNCRCPLYTTFNMGTPKSTTNAVGSSMQPSGEVVPVSFRQTKVSPHLSFFTAQNPENSDSLHVRRVENVRSGFPGTQHSLARVSRVARPNSLRRLAEFELAGNGRAGMACGMCLTTPSIYVFDIFLDIGHSPLCPTLHYIKNQGVWP
jgi:hypothetical protein